MCMFVRIFFLQIFASDARIAHDVFEIGLISIEYDTVMIGFIDDKK